MTDYTDESYLQGVDVGFTGEKKKYPRVALPARTYGNGKQPGLYIKKYTGQGEETSGATRHGWLVLALNGTEGSAFLNISLRPWYTTPEGMKLAGFGIPDSAINATALNLIQEGLAEQAAAKVEAANTPDDQKESAITDAIAGELTRVRINVGQILRLQDWAGGDFARIGKPSRSIASWNPESFVGVEFSGSIQKGNKPDSAQVKTVFHKEA